LKDELDIVKATHSESSGAGAVAAALVATELIEHKNKNSANEKLIEEMNLAREESEKA